MHTDEPRLVTIIRFEADVRAELEIEIRGRGGKEEIMVVVGVRTVLKRGLGVDPVPSQCGAPSKQRGVMGMLHDLLLEPLEGALTPFSVQGGDVDVKQSHEAVRSVLWSSRLTPSREAHTSGNTQICQFRLVP